MSRVLELADALRRLSTDDLAHVISLYGLPPRAVADYFDLAEYVQSADATQRALATLDREALAAIAVASERGESAVPLADVASCLTAFGSLAVDAVTQALNDAAALFLVTVTDAAVAVPENARAAIAEWPALGLPGVAELAGTPRPHAAPASNTLANPARNTAESTAETDPNRAGLRAFAAVTAIASMIDALGEEPARELRRGGLAQPDERRLAEVAHRNTADVPILIASARAAGLVALADRDWLPTERAQQWAAESTANRWVSLAAAWLDQVPERARPLLDEFASAGWREPLRATLVWQFPAATHLHETVESLTHRAELLGATLDGRPTAALRALMNGKRDEAVHALEAVLPAEVDRVYIQHDLSVVAPGPLAPHIHERMNTLADVESRAPASTYRITASSVNHAIASGETRASLEQFLAEVSLTGIPQPLAYLLAEASERFGRVRVRRASGVAGSSIHSDDSALIETIQVDAALAPLSLRRESPWQLSSRQSRDVVYWALLEARYPVVAEDDQGDHVTPARGRVASIAEPAPDPARLLAEGLVATTSGEATKRSPHDWIARQLDLAIRARTTLIVAVRMPDGTAAEFSFEPLGVSGGRARGRDNTTDVERTFPLSSIESVRAAH